METQDRNPKEHGLRDPSALMIGHDPRLAKSETLADYALFVNYYFDNTIKDRAYKSKYGLASAAFNQIVEITNGKIKPEEIYVTNLCNSLLPAVNGKGNVYIPEEKAADGVENIKRILHENPSIEYIFPMSLQVNYWLQKLGLYYSTDEFVEYSKSMIDGVVSEPPYYKPIKQRTFLMICGNSYPVIGGKQIVIPTLHAKCFPLNRQFRAYEVSYERIRDYFS